MELTCDLGIQIKQNKRSLLLHQTRYVNKVLTRFNKMACKPAVTPMTKDELADEETLKDEPYREAVGALIYLSNTTRIDISFGTNHVARLVANPTCGAWTKVKRILRYLKGTQNAGIEYIENGNREPVFYCDADFAGDIDTRRSTTGYLAIFANGPILWKCQKRSLVTLSSSEAEYVAICSTAKEMVWLRKLAIELNTMQQRPIKLLSDSQSALKIAKSEKVAQRTRHISAQEAYLKELMEKGIINIEHVKGDENLADGLTKPLQGAKFSISRN